MQSRLQWMRILCVVSGILLGRDAEAASLPTTSPPNLKWILGHTNLVVETDITFDGVQYWISVRGDDLFSRTNRAGQLALLRVKCDGQTNGPFIDLGRNGVGPFLAGGDGCCFSVWAGQTNQNKYAVFGQVFSGSGLPINPPLPIGTAAVQSYPGWGAAACFDGHQFIVVWEAPAAQGSKIILQRINPEGTLADLPLEIAASGYGPVIGASGKRILVAWMSGNGQVTARFIEPDGKMAEPRSLGWPNFGGSRVRWPAIVVIEDRFLVVWGDSRLGLNGQFIDGKPLPFPFVLDPAFYSDNLQVACDGIFLLAWGTAWGTSSFDEKAEFFDATGRQASAGFKRPSWSTSTVRRMIFGGNRYVLVLRGQNSLALWFIPRGNDLPHIDLSFNPHWPLLIWCTPFPGLSYTLQGSTNLCDWVPFKQITGSELPISASFGFGSSRAFYRLVPE